MFLCGQDLKCVMFYSTGCLYKISRPTMQSPHAVLQVGEIIAL